MSRRFTDIALIDGPSVVGWSHWREVCQRHVFGLAQDLLLGGMEAGLVRQQPVRPLAHILMGASDEAALYVAEAADRGQARTEMIDILDRLIDAVLVRDRGQLCTFPCTQLSTLIAKPPNGGITARSARRRNRGLARLRWMRT